MRVKGKQDITNRKYMTFYNLLYWRPAMKACDAGFLAFLIKFPDIIYNQLTEVL